VLSNEQIWKNPLYPLAVNDSWVNGSDVNEEIARRMIQDSADLGFEMFHLDAGWSRSVGDWQPDPAKFPRGLQPIVDDVHARGLKFGLWTEWAQAALGTSPGALNVRSPKVRGWLTTDLPANWKPDGLKGQTIDIGDPPAKAWAMHETDRIVNDYKLDMLQHDGYVVAKGCDASGHPHMPPDPLNKSKYQDAGYIFAGGSNSTDVSYHATRAYYDIQSNLRRRHPELLLEISNDGGRMIDFGSAAHGDYFSLTNAYDPLSNRRAFYDATYILPPFMLETPVESWLSDSSPSRSENFLYMLRSGMMGWLDVMIDTTTWNAQQREAAKQEIQLYKSQLRPLIREADIYHISDRPDGMHWDAMEYFDPRARRGVVYIFHGSNKTEIAHRFPIRGVDPAAKYQLRFRDHSAKDQTYGGDYLLNSGLFVKLPAPYSSDIVFFEELPASPPSPRH
jgi:alpha-galactosidase